MARPLKPWYHRRKQAWVIEPAGKLHVLVEGPDDAATEKKAREQLVLYQAEQIELSRAHPPVDCGNPTVASVVEAFLVYDERHCGPRTHAERTYYLQLFCEAHGRKLLSECKSFHLKDWLDDHAEWENPSTRGNIIRCVKRAFNWAVKDDRIPRNPFLGVQQPKRTRRRPVTQEEFDSLVTAAGKKKRLARFVEALRFIKWTGARPCEVEAVRWEHLHIDLEKGQGMLVLPEHKTAKATKDHSPRVIQLIDPVVQLLLEIKRRGDHHQFVFVGKGKKPWSRNGLQQNVRRLRREIGLDEKVVLYGIRHEFATRSIRNGVALKDLADLLGHKTTRMAEHYVHGNGQEPHLAAAMRRANGLS